MIPQANISSARHKNYLEHAADLNRRGYKTLHMVVGSDRADEFRNTLERYNGRPDKNGRILYHFPGGIHVHVAGQEREEGSQGVAGSSSSNQERYARAGDYNSFARNAPVGAKPEHVRAMYDEIRSSDLKEDSDDEERRQAAMNAPETPMSSALKKYTPIGTVDELGSALHKGDVKGAILPAAKLATNVIPSLKLGMMASGAVGAAEAIRDKKPLKENTTGSVGGLGFNTGNPAADANALQQYTDTNGALAKDDENGNLIKMHNALHAPLGFKEFDPKKDLAKGKK
jgi:hypothetical protein